MKNKLKPEIEIWYNFKNGHVRIIYKNRPRELQEYYDYKWRKSILLSQEITNCVFYEKVSEL